MTILRKPEQFREDEIQTVLEKMSKKQKEDVAKKVIAPISSALNLLKDVYGHFLLLPDVETLTMRAETLQTLLAHFEVQMPESQYPAVLKNAGRSIGRSFSRDFIQTLRGINSVPMNLSALIGFWLQIESRARWGTFDVKKETKDEVIIEAKDLFLTRGLSDRRHRNCAFMEGYVESFLWETTKTCCRWIQQQYRTDVAEAFPEPSSVKDEPFGMDCRYSISLKKEELTEAFDAFYQAMEYSSIGNYESAVLSLRTALEQAFKSKIRIETSKYVSLTEIIRIFKAFDILPLPSYRMIKDLYGRSSAIIHRSVPATKEYADTLIYDAGEVLRVLELTYLEEEKRKKLLGSISASQVDQEKKDQELHNSDSDKIL